MFSEWAVGIFVLIVFCCLCCFISFCIDEVVDDIVFCLYCVNIFLWFFGYCEIFWKSWCFSILVFFWLGGFWRIIFFFFCRIIVFRIICCWGVGFGIGVFNRGWDCIFWMIYLGCCCWVGFWIIFFWFWGLDGDIFLW